MLAEPSLTDFASVPHSRHDACGLRKVIRVIGEAVHYGVSTLDIIFEMQLPSSSSLATTG